MNRLSVLEPTLADMRGSPDLDSALSGALQHHNYWQSLCTELMYVWQDYENTGDIYE